MAAVDPETYALFLKAQLRAQQLGYPLVEVLDRNQLLLTARRRHELQVQANEDLYRRLDRQNPNKLMAYFYDRTDGTAHEMFEAMKQWLALVINNQADKTLEDL